MVLIACAWSCLAFAAVHEASCRLWSDHDVCTHLFELRRPLLPDEAAVVIEHSAFVVAYVGFVLMGETPSSLPMFVATQLFYDLRVNPRWRGWAHMCSVAFVGCLGGTMFARPFVQYITTCNVWRRVGLIWRILRGTTPRTDNGTIPGVEGLHRLFVGVFWVRLLWAAASHWAWCMWLGLGVLDARRLFL